MLLASAIVLTAFPSAAPALLQDPASSISARELASWYDEMEAVFEDADAVARASELIGQSLKFHGHELFTERGGLQLNLEYRDMLVSDRHDEPFAQTEGFGTLYLAPGGKTVWIQKLPKELARSDYAQVRYVHDGETAWINVRGRDNHTAVASRTAFNMIMRQQILSGLPYFLTNSTLKVAALPASEPAEGSRPVDSIRVRLEDPVFLGILAGQGKPEPVQLFEVDFDRETHQLVSIRYWMFRSGKVDPRSRYFEYFHEFSNEFADDDFKAPKMRLTDLSPDGSKGREQVIKAVIAGPPPSDFFVQGWKILPVLPADPLSPPERK